MPNRNLAILLACASLVDLAMNMPGTILPLIMLQYGYTQERIASVLFVPILVALVTTLPSGSLVDRFGSRTTLLFCTAGLALSTLALLAAHSQTSIAWVLAARSVCYIAFTTASFCVAASSPSERERLAGVTWLAMAVTAAYSIGPALSIFLMRHHFGEVQFAWSAGACVLAAAIVPLFSRDISARVRSKNTVPGVPYGAWLAPLCFCAAVTTIGGVNGTLAVVALHAKGLNGGFFFSATALGMLAGRIPAAAIVRRYGPLCAAASLASLMLAGGTLLALAQSDVQMIAGAFLAGAAWSGMLPACTSMLLRASPPGARGRAMAAYTFAMTVGATAGGAAATQFARMPNGYSIAIEIACALPLAALAFLHVQSRTLLDAA